MFDKITFGNIIKEIKKLYDNQETFAKKADVSRTYLSQYMNQNLDAPPGLEILKKIADASQGITTYEELMKVCGYIDIDNFVPQNDWDELLKKTNEIGMNDEEKEIFLTINKRSLKEKKSMFQILKEFDLSDESYNNIIEAIRLHSKFQQDNVSKLMQETFKLYKGNDFVLLPVYGRISAGQPLYAEQNIITYLPTLASEYHITNKEDYFYLQIEGDSMDKIIKNNDFVLIKKQDCLENGDIGAILVNGYDATIKKFKQRDNLVILEPQSNNPKHDIQIYDTNKIEIRILGKAIGHFGKI
jgi:SOS-response transcriptional repressor LexA